MSYSLSRLFLDDIQSRPNLFCWGSHGVACWLAGFFQGGFFTSSATLPKQCEKSQLATEVSSLSHTLRDWDRTNEENGQPVCLSLRRFGGTKVAFLRGRQEKLKRRRRRHSRIVFQISKNTFQAWNANRPAGERGERGGTTGIDSHLLPFPSPTISFVFSLPFFCFFFLECAPKGMSVVDALHSVGPRG